MDLGTFAALDDFQYLRGNGELQSPMIKMDFGGFPSGLQTCCNCHILLWQGFAGFHDSRCPEGTHGLQRLFLCKRLLGRDDLRVVPDLHIASSPRDSKPVAIVTYFCGKTLNGFAGTHGLQRLFLCKQLLARDDLRVVPDLHIPSSPRFFQQKALELASYNLIFAWVQHRMLHALLLLSTALCQRGKKFVGDMTCIDPFRVVLKSSCDCVRDTAMSAKSVFLMSFSWGTMDWQTHSPTLSLERASKDVRLNVSTWVIKDCPNSRGQSDLVQSF
eukprot:s1043_g10.t2